MEAKSSGQAPRVFVSYAHKPAGEKDWVRGLAEMLVAKGGLDVRLDQWYCGPGDRLAEFMEREYRLASHVIIVCTPEYATKADGRIEGVGYEGHFISQCLYSGSSTKRFVPLFRRGADAPGFDCGLPTFLQGMVYVDFRDQADTVCHQRLMELVRAILNIPKYGPPERSQLPRLTTITSREDLLAQESLTKLRDEMERLEGEERKLQSLHEEWFRNSIDRGWLVGMRQASYSNMANISDQIEVVRGEREKVQRTIEQLEKSAPKELHEKPTEGGSCPYCESPLVFYGTRLYSGEVREVFTCRGQDPHLVYGDVVLGADD